MVSELKLADGLLRRGSNDRRGDDHVRVPYDQGIKELRFTGDLESIATRVRVFFIANVHTPEVRKPSIEVGQTSDGRGAEATSCFRWVASEREP